MFFDQSAWGMAPASPEGQGAPPSNFLWQMMPFILIFVIFYFILIRPQKRQQEKHRQLLSNLRKGDRVVTSSGIYGVVVKTEEDSVILAVGEIGGIPSKKKVNQGENIVNMRFLKSAIATVFEESKPGDQSEKDSSGEAEKSLE